MSKYSPAQTTEWVAENLRKKDEVSAVEVLANQVLRVSRVNHGRFVGGIISASRVEAATISSIVHGEHPVEIIANVPNESYWTGEALRLAKENHIATGAYADLFRVLRVAEVRNYQPKEFEFIERGLDQHDRISKIDRLHDRMYRITRDGLPDLTVAMLNEYELTADHLRTARQRYGEFSIAVITNPNGTPTSTAMEVAKSVGVEILKWGPFFGRLNKK